MFFKCAILSALLLMLNRMVSVFFRLRKSLADMQDSISAGESASRKDPRIEGLIDDVVVKVQGANLPHTQTDQNRRFLNECQYNLGFFYGLVLLVLDEKKVDDKDVHMFVLTSALGRFFDPTWVKFACLKTVITPYKDETQEFKQGAHYSAKQLNIL
ncbi:hypothetical protein VCHA53O466_50480 [Vibrio chagasii]|nr:hypothetical protein VCHA53O466_50480 [Vibrio chagasii]